MKVTKKRVEAAARKLEQHFDIEAGTLHVGEPGFHANGWTIYAEEGVPYEWTYQAWPVLNTDGGLFFEPVNHWCLGVHNG